MSKRLSPIQREIVLMLIREAVAAVSRGVVFLYQKAKAYFAKLKKKKEETDANL